MTIVLPGFLLSLFNLLLSPVRVASFGINEKSGEALPPSAVREVDVSFSAAHPRNTISVWKIRKIREKNGRGDTFWKSLRKGVSPPFRVTRGIHSDLQDRAPGLTGVFSDSRLAGFGLRCPCHLLAGGWLLPGRAEATDSNGYDGPLVFRR